jgi:hypothetical protein
MSIIDCETVIVDKLEHDAKALLSIDKTVSGIIIEVILVQLENALALI